MIEKYINKICYGDNINLLEKFSNNSIDLIITSPPYKDKDGYNPYTMGLTAIKTFDKLKDNAFLFLNFGHLKEDKYRPFRVCNYFITSGFKLADTITWVKNHYTPLNGKKNLNNLTEFIFMLYKGEMPDMDRLSIGVEYKDKSNVGRYSDRDLKCGGNVWHIDIPTITKKSQRLHKDEYPVKLPENCIKLSGLKQGVVLDVFGGSGTTAFAAQKLGLNWITVDKNYTHCQTAQDRFFKEFNQEIEIVRL